MSTTIFRFLKKSHIKYNMDLCNVSLPNPSEAFIEAIKRESMTREIDERVYAMVTASNPTINCVPCIYFSTEELTEFGKREFGPFFEEEFTVVGIRFTNQHPDSLAFYPPHIDHSRLTSINFTIEPGGCNVITSFYESCGSYSDLRGDMTAFERETVKTAFLLEKHTWAALNVKQTHSVSNIETERLVLTLSFAKNTLSELTSKYPALFSVP